MKMTLEEVEKVIEEFTEDEREILLQKLLEKTDPVISQIEKAWIAESERRLDSYESGQEKSYSTEEIFSKYRK
jgi:putative addiction module component (TIGR02574 family)